MTLNRIIIKEPSLGLSLQDYGRFGWRRYGISTAGAMDRMHLSIANRLVGNSPDTAAIETVMMGCQLEIVGPPVLLAASGPGCTLSIDERPVPTGHSAEAEEGQAVILSPVRDGVYGYLAVAGGFDFSDDLGSLSGHRRSGLGHHTLGKSAELPVRMGGCQVPQVITNIPRPSSGPIRVLWGPQEDWFGAGVRNQLVTADWTIDHCSDRMGIFLHGLTLAPNAGSMVSDGVLPGSIQVPPSGKPVILMRDCQTTGGYPKIATVISADLDRLAQIRPGQPLQFMAASRQMALEALKIVRNSIDALRTTAAVREPSTALLLQHNLIDGVWSDHPDKHDPIL
jgi:biotin-dependent carboxylase-like uncharacterized protein